MTLPDEKLQTLIETIRIVHIKYGVDYISLSLDSKKKDVDPTGRGISYSWLSNIVDKGVKPREGGRAIWVLRQLVKKLKIKYPVECEKVDSRQ